MKTKPSVASVYVALLLTASVSSAGFFDAPKSFSPEAKAQAAAFVQVYEKALKAKGAKARTIEEMQDAWSNAVLCQNAGSDNKTELLLFKVESEANPRNVYPAPRLTFTTSEGQKTRHEMQATCKEIAAAVLAQSIEGCGTKYLVLESRIQGNGQWAAPTLFQGTTKRWSAVPCERVKPRSAADTNPDLAAKAVEDWIRHECGPDTAFITHTAWKGRRVNALGAIVTRTAQASCYSKRKLRSDWLFELPTRSRLTSGEKK